MRRSLTLLLLFLLAACGGGQDQVIVPTNTPDPLAFFAPTPISPGQPENPLRIVFVPRTDVTTFQPDDTGDAADATAVPAAAALTIEQAISALDAELEATSGLAIEILAVASDAEALNLLCDYNDEDRFAAPWLGGPSAVLAIQRGCGEAVFEGVRAGRTRLGGQIISASGVGLRGLSGRTYCRLGRGDFYSWILPSLALDADGINPTSVTDVDDVEQYPLLLDAVSAGDCAATGVPEGFLQLDTFEAYRNRITVTSTLSPMPYGVLIYPPELLLDDSAALTDAFLEIAGVEIPEDDTGAAPDTDLVEVDTDALTTPQLALLTLMGAEGVQLTDEESLADVFEFMDATEIVAGGQS
ncbi:MAG: PhnD/SsuA/transferrin family substrate-binding protein [Chloroflexota bacterium]